MTVPAGQVLLGTVAIEPNRWATVDPSGAPSIVLADWLPAIAGAGFDGIELWERHLPDAPADAAPVIEGPPPITVFNTYVGFDTADPAERTAVARRVARTGATGVKCNVGNDPRLVDAYGDRLAAWLDDLPAPVAVLCECHAGISVAEDPVVAARIFDRAGGRDRMQAIVHTHEPSDQLRARFDAYGDRITHVHINHLDLATASVPTLAATRVRFEATVALLDELGFGGSWTIEFVHGLLTDGDEPVALLDQAVEDLAVVRSVLGAGSP